MHSQPFTALVFPESFGLGNELSVLNSSSHKSLENVSRLTARLNHAVYWYRLLQVRYLNNTMSSDDARIYNIFRATLQRRLTCGLFHGTWSLTGVWLSSGVSAYVRDSSGCGELPGNYSTLQPVYNDHLMGYFAAFWSSSRWPLAIYMSSRRQKLLARVNWYLQSSLKHITE